jgi:4-amino-4-deoxy-L-arabinose transferase-like glycosyltransferase
MPRARQIAARWWGVAPALAVVALLALRACVAAPPLDNLAPAPADPRDPPGTHAVAGSLYIARGGPVIVGFVAPQPARLVIGSGDPVRGGAPAVKELVGRGQVKERIVLPAGPIAIRFAAPPGARLVWSPVGRRGDPEYVPASSLSPEPPERARFGAWTGAAPLDGIIASLLLVTLVATLVALARHRLRLVPRRMWLAMAAIFIMACGARWIGLCAFGQTWDEDVNWAAGKNYITNVLALDFALPSWIWNYEHPPVMKYLAGIGAQFADGYGPARALSAVWVALGCALLVPIGARLYSLRVGILAAAIAALLPPLVAHGQIVGHEAPTVLWWALAILLALTIHDAKPGGGDASGLDTASPRTVRVRLVWLGVVIGIAVASRFVNGLVGVLAFVIAVERAPRPRMLRTTIEGALIMPATAALTLYAIWPRLWEHPIASLEASLAKLSQPHSLEPFLGAITNQPGPHYFVAYLIATLPVGILAGVILYLVRAARDRDRAALVVAAWFVIPLAVVFSPVRQDGVRYVMPCILALAVGAAAGFDMVATAISSRLTHGRSPHGARVFPALGAAVVLYLAITVARVHPYYLDYFGEHVGGAGTVAKKRMFETAWWGEGLDRAVGYVNERAAPGARVYRNCIEPVHLAWFRYDLWTPMTSDPAQADWIVTYSPAIRPCPKPADARRVFVVEAQGAALAEVWQRQR